MLTTWLLSSFQISAQNWPQFRGTQALGWTDQQNLPAQWDLEASKNVKWKLEIPGVGHSSPVIWENQIFLTTAIGDPWNWRNDAISHSWRIYSIDKTTGKILWQQTASEGNPKTRRHEKSSQANSTPATDGKYVAAVMSSEGLFVYSVDGKLLWKKDLGFLNPGLAGDKTSHWGHASSPIIYKNLVIVQCDKHEDSYLAAYNLPDGKEVWRTARADELPSWSTPTIYEGKNRVELITSGQFVRGYDPMTGKELWRFSDPAEVKQPTPFVVNDVIIYTGGYPRGRPIFALRTGATGDISNKADQSSNSNIVWKTEKGGPYTPTPLAYNGYLYAVQNGGVLTCWDMKTGQLAYEQKLDGNYSASPIASDGNVYFTSEDGHIVVIKAGPKFELLSKNEMGAPCYATPAISDKTLFVRTLEQIVAIETQAATGSD
jgi:outer membrane protein assembly factor BamB